MIRVREGNSWTGQRSIDKAPEPPYRYTNTGFNTGNNACTFRCKDEGLLSGYHWDASTKKCIPNQERCPALPEHAEWYTGFANPQAHKIADRKRDILGNQGRIPQHNKPFGYYEELP